MYNKFWTTTYYFFSRLIEKDCELSTSQTSIFQIHLIGGKTSRQVKWKQNKCRGGGFRDNRIFHRFIPAFSRLVVIDKWRSKKEEEKREKERREDEKNARGWVGKGRELQFHRIPEDEGAAVLEAFHGKPNIRGILHRSRPEFPA